MTQRLHSRHYTLLDIQWVTAHLAQFGAIEVPRRRYLRMLDHSLKLDCSFV
jgi:leucyl/phenylalanyl-tRNA--protein transferase